MKPEYKLYQELNTRELPIQTKNEDIKHMKIEKKQINTRLKPKLN